MGFDIVRYSRFRYQKRKSGIVPPLVNMNVQMRGVTGSLF